MLDSGQHDAGRRGRGRVPDHRDRRIRDAQLPQRSDRHFAEADERADSAADACSQVLVPEEDTQPEKVQFERIIGGLAKQLAPRLIASSADTALICRFFRGPEQDFPIRYGSDQKSFRPTGTEREEAALCCSDSDLLPPRSRYPLKWAQNRQPSPPPRWRFWALFYPGTAEMIRG